ncbi:MAG: AtpZ/AtpI family protein [Candidatus Lernaella stagnicola]|nr:AtpZ/AtpI family protein [Candidatus Lernaella stagnicola]
MAGSLKDLKHAASIGSVGLEMGAAVAIGYVVGYYLDKWLGTDPWMKIIWIVFGLGAAAKAIFVAYKAGKRIGEEDEPESSDHQ